MELKMVAWRRLWSLCAVLGVLRFCSGQSIPRISSMLGGAARTLSKFVDAGNTTTLLLSPDGTTLYVGARDAVLSLDVSQTDRITLKHKFEWASKRTPVCQFKEDCGNYIRVLQFLNTTHLYVCGTFAFQPHGTVISADTLEAEGRKPTLMKGHCPHSPTQRNTALSVDGELYVGTTADFNGHIPAISRLLSQGQRRELTLENLSGALNSPTFISSSFIRREGKVYFFFTETADEYSFMEKFTLPRVGQVCADDNGGVRTLQKRWTTFAKAQLVCQQGAQLPFNVLQDMVALERQQDHTLFYGVFSSEWSLSGSAVCAFSLRDVRAVFSGNYKTFDMSSSQWQRQVNPGGLGQCGSHNESDIFLNLVKKTFLTEKSVKAMGSRALLVSEDHRYSRLAVQRAQAATGSSYTILYLLSESGFLHKAVLLESGAHIIEEVQVFKQPQIMTSILLSVSKGVVFVGSSEGVLQVPVANCSFYASCAECVLAQDPHCGWDPSTHTCVAVSAGQTDLAQDVEQGDVAKQCEGSPSAAPLSRATTVAMNNYGQLVVLPCLRRSKRALLSWTFQNRSLQNLHLQLENGSLVFLATPETRGRYLCVSVERSYQQILADYVVRLGVSHRASGRSNNPPQTPPHPASHTVTHRCGSAEPVTQREEVGLSPGAEMDATLGAAEETAKPPVSTENTQNPSNRAVPLVEVRTYFGELVAVCIVFVCVSVLLIGALYWQHQKHCGIHPKYDPAKEAQADGSLACATTVPTDVTP